MIIAVSDLHLGWKDEGKQEKFLEFLERCDSRDIDHLVLLGDIFDFWRRSNGKIFSCTETNEKNRRLVKNNTDIIAKLGQLQAKNIHYVVGNHDYYIHRLKKRNPDSYHFQVSKTKRLQDGRNWFFFTHGYDIDVYATMESLMSIDQYEQLSESLCFMTDKTGWLAHCIWEFSEVFGKLKDKIDYLQQSPDKRQSDIDAIKAFADSCAAYLYLGMCPTDSLVYGHTHVPYREAMDGGRCVANTGSWSGDGPCTFVRISDGELEVLTYSGQEIV
jgi:UDP-2,3-diacylglucosamine pyrophosphatase LpxH